MATDFVWDNPIESEPDELVSVKVYATPEIIQVVSGYLFTKVMAFPIAGTYYRKSYANPDSVNSFGMIAVELSKVLAVDLRQKPTDENVLQQQDANGDWVDVFDFTGIIAGAITEITSNITTVINNVSRNNITIDKGIEVAGSVYNNYEANYSSSAGDVYPDLDYGDADDPDRNKALCTALTGYVDAFCNNSLDFLAETEDQIEEYKMLTGIASVGLVLLAGVLAVASGGLTLAIGLVGAFGSALGLTAPIAFGIIDKISDTSEETFADTDARAMVVCAMYNNLVGQDVTLGLFQGSLSAYPDNPTNSHDTDLAEALHEMNQLEQSHAMFLDNWNYQLGVSSAGIPLASDCSGCDDNWCYDQTFNGSGVGAYTMSHGTDTATGLAPQEFSTGGNRVNRVQLSIDLGASYNVTKARLYFTATVYQNSTPTPFYTVFEFSDSGGLAFSVAEVPVTRTGDYYLEWTGSSNRFRFGDIRVVAGGENGTDPIDNAGDCRVTRVYYEGVGVNPFGTDNC